MSLRTLTFVTVALLAALPAGDLAAQLRTTPSPPPPTLWSFLGLPQAMRHSKDSLANHFGKHPKLERKPPLKALADPANLDSDVPAIKAAAEVKQAEDLKPQKIKAVRYLAEIGCGCYNKDGKITDALVNAMTDCTEDVRKAAIDAIAEAAKGEACENCKQQSCCNEKITKQLADLAYELDENGCPLEPSQRVRQAAIEALAVCCPSYGPPMEPQPVGPGEIEGLEGPGEIETPSEPMPEDDLIQPGPPGDLPPGQPDELPPEPLAARYAPPTLDKAIVQAALRQVAHSGPQDEASVEDAERRASIVVAADGHTARIRFPGKESFAAGQQLHVYRPEFDRFRRAGEVEVVGVVEGATVVRPLAGLDLRVISAGAIVVAP